MTQCTETAIRTKGPGGREVVAAFDGGDISSDAGALLLGEVERHRKILGRFAGCFADHRSPTRIEHSAEEIVAQRVLAIALGYEDVNDHEALRLDPLLAALVGKSDPKGGRRKHETRKSWSRSRRVVAKVEHLERGANPRFVVTSLDEEKIVARELYEDLYCARGEMENRIKEQQLDLFADRTSCHLFRANQVRVYLSSFAYVLLSELRRIGLAGTEMARAQCGTIRTKLLKIGARVRITVRRIWISMSESYPYADLLFDVWRRLQPT